MERILTYIIYVITYRYSEKKLPYDGAITPKPVVGSIASNKPYYSQNEEPG
jgi:hypothetical protein